MFLVYFLMMKIQAAKACAPRQICGTRYRLIKVFRAGSHKLDHFHLYLSREGLEMDHLRL